MKYEKSSMIGWLEAIGMMATLIWLLLAGWWRPKDDQFVVEEGSRYRE